MRVITLFVLLHACLILILHDFCTPGTYVLNILNTQTWIDVISDQLVNVLEFIGVCLRVPSSVMGMTVLAWGNSVGDYTTNGALAAKGLADMSMSAW